MRNRWKCAEGDGVGKASARGAHPVCSACAGSAESCAGNTSSPNQPQLSEEGCFQQKCQTSPDTLGAPAVAVPSCLAPQGSLS